jgi:hypothetical protein
VRRVLLQFEQIGAAMEPTRRGLTLAEVERGHILDMLEFCRGNRTHAARLLDISVRGLRNKLVAYAQSGCDVFETNAHFGRLPRDLATSPIARVLETLK